MTGRMPSPNAQAANGQAAGADADPAAPLIQALTPAIARPVDELHVAAVLESTGVTDQAALDTYRYDNVFTLADAVYQRMPAVSGPAVDDEPPAQGQPGGSVRLLTHGLLYILPSTVYPAVLVALGAAAMIRGLVFATTLGWVWGMGVSVVAYQLVGRGKDRIAIAALPLILGMGMLEWRAHRFTAKVGTLWGRVAVCEEFCRAAWWLLLEELGNCLAVLGALGAILLIVLHETGTLSARGAMLIDAHVLLGGAFFLGFLLARYQQFGRLLAIMALVVAADVLMLPWAATRLAPDGAVPVFLFCTMALLTAQLITLRTSFRHLYYYR